MCTSPACMSTNVARFRLAWVKLNRTAYRHRVSSYWNSHASDDRIGVRSVSHHQQQQHSTSSRIATHTRVTFFVRRSRSCHMLLVRVSPSGCKAKPKAAPRPKENWRVRPFGQMLVSLRVGITGVLERFHITHYNIEREI